MSSSSLSVVTFYDNTTYIFVWNGTVEEDWEWDKLEGSESLNQSILVAMWAIVRLLDCNCLPDMLLVYSCPFCWTEENSEIQSAKESLTWAHVYSLRLLFLQQQKLIVLHFISWENATMWVKMGFGGIYSLK